MPRSLLCGCLSSAAVDRCVDSAATAQMPLACCQCRVIGHSKTFAGHTHHLTSVRWKLTQAGLPAVNMAKDADIDVQPPRLHGHLFKGASRLRCTADDCFAFRRPSFAQDDHAREDCAHRGCASHSEHADVA